MSLHASESQVSSDLSALLADSVLAAASQVAALRPSAVSDPPPTADASIPAGDVRTAVSPHSSFASSPHSLASSLLESADFSHDSCVRLLHMAFPCPLRARRPGLLGDAPASYFVLGGFKCPPRQGVTKLTASHEPLVKYLNHWLMQVFAGRSWSSLVVSHNTCTGVHMDRNAQGTLNFCTALGSFSGGGIWLESETGDTAFWDSSSSCLRMGQVLEVHNAACVFDGAKRHATMPWAGDRWLLIAYTSVNEHDVSGEDWAKLGSLSFPCVQQHAQSVLRPVETFTAEEPSVQVTSARAFPPPQGSAEAASSMQPPLQPCTAPEAVQPACPRLFLDLFSGARAPLSAALRQLPGSHLGPPDSFEPVDVIFGHHCDILDDENYARMLQVTGSGLVGAASAAPICSHHSILKLRKGGPAPVRTPWALDGLSSNTWQQALTAQESSLLHDRARELLLRVAVNGGLILFENPPSSLTFHDPLMKSWLRSVAPYISQVAACSHGLHLRKRWAFACNKPEIMSLASVCEHAADYHESHLGERLPDGTFYSRLTAEYPPSLACALAAIIRPYVTAQGHCVPLESWRSLLPVCSPFPCLPHRVEDGAGIHSSAAWFCPQMADVFGSLRKAWMRRLSDTALCLKIARHFVHSVEGPPLSESELAPFIHDLCEFCGVSALQSTAFLSVSEGQPFRLRVLQRLLELAKDPEVAICPLLDEGVRLGVGCTIPPSSHWPQSFAPEPEIDLTICEGSWASAAAHPQQVGELLTAELEAGWIQEYSSLQAIEAAFPLVACGKLGLVLAEGRSPRLVVDSSISGVTQSCALPNRILLPKISDVAACAPSHLGAEEWVAASIDVRKAHRLIKIHPEDQGLLSFSWQGRFFICKTLNFGARPSSFWWARVAGCLLRLSHAFIFLPHLMWAYVDDFLAGFQKSTGPLHLGVLVLLFMVLGVPISWNKCAYGPSVVWLGWSINLQSWTTELCEVKVNTLLAQLDAAMCAQRVPLKLLQSLTGRLLWVTSLWRVLRPLLSPLYKALLRIPCTNVAVSPHLWAQLLQQVDEHAIISGSVSHTSFPVGARITRVGNDQVSCSSDLSRVVFAKRRLWVAVEDPENPDRLLDASARASLSAWHSLLLSSCLVFPMRTATPLHVVAEADAFAEADVCGLGGHVTWPSGSYVWFSIFLHRDELVALSVLFAGPLQSHIAALELLAQLCLLWCVHRQLPACRTWLSVPLRCDNSGAEAVAGKGLSSVPLMAAVARAFLHFQRSTCIRAEVEHIAGYRNTLADELSRLRAASGSLELHARLHPPLQTLFSAGSNVLLAPAGSSWPKHLRGLAERA